MTFEEVKDNCNLIATLLETKIRIDDGNAVASYINQLREISGFITNVEAAARTHYHIKVGQIADSYQGLSATMLKHKINANAWEEAEYLKIAERLGKNWSTVMDSLRSLLSNLKTDKQKGL